MANVNSKYFFLLSICLALLACNPYKGFKGVNPKGMSNKTAPSQELKDDYKKASKKMKRQYKKEMRKRRNRMGSKPENTP